MAAQARNGPIPWLSITHAQPRQNCRFQGNWTPISGGRIVRRVGVSDSVSDRRRHKEDRDDSFSGQSPRVVLEYRPGEGGKKTGAAEQRGRVLFLGVLTKMGRTPLYAWARLVGSSKGGS